MCSSALLLRRGICWSLVVPCALQLAQAQSSPAQLSETIQVTATRVPEDVEAVPASVAVVTGDELRARGATDLHQALALVAGVSIAPGGDGGPAGAVPEIWGLREFDAFLLVVDGIPWGGAFLPDTPTLDLSDVERIEVLRGPSPVMYGATSFSGVIQVIRRAPGAGGGRVNVSYGSHESGEARISMALPNAGSFAQSLSADGFKRGYKDDRAGADRGHFLYRAAGDLAGGRLRLDVDGTVQKQDPASPHVRQGAVLSRLVPLDANHNPKDARIDDDRFRFAAGFDHAALGGDWSTLLSYTRAKRETVRGFLASVSNTPQNAIGFEQELDTDEVYFDTHLAWKKGETLQVVAGFDHTFGRAEAEAETFRYSVALNGSGAQSSTGRPRLAAFELEDERNFSGLYTQVEWDPAPRWHIQLGGRVNHTAEDREAGEEELTGPDPGEEEEEGKATRTTTRGSGILGVSYLAWTGKSEGDGLWVFADVRDTYKPAVLDFGPEAEGEILKPETARSYEAGIKGHLAHGRLDLEIAGFEMDFDNLVVAQVSNGLPRLVNAGQQRFKGIDAEARYHIRPELSGVASWSHHDSRFRNYVQAFDGVLTQLRGKRLETVPQEHETLGLVYAPATGFIGHALFEHVGDRYLNKRNTALAAAYDTWSAGIGYRFSRYEIRLDGENLNDARDPISESELGDAQYYRLPARSLRLAFDIRL